MVAVSVLFDNVEEGEGEGGIEAEDDRLVEGEEVVFAEIDLLLEREAAMMVVELLVDKVSVEVGEE